MKTIGNRSPANAYEASGVWDMNGVAVQQMLNLWAPDKDPYFANVVLLIQPKAGDTTIVDRSATPKTVTVNGSSALAGPSAFTGGASIYMPGTSSSRLSLADSADWVLTGFTFTIDGFFRTPPAIVAGQNTVCGQYSNTTANRASLVAFSPTIFNAQVYNSAGTEFEVRSDTGSTLTPIADALYYFAFVGDGTNLRLYINSAQVGSTVAVSGTARNTTSTFCAGGQDDANNLMTGWLQALRVTNGVARYSGASITRPTRPFSLR